MICHTWSNILDLNIKPDGSRLFSTFVLILILGATAARGLPPSRPRPGRGLPPAPATGAPFARALPNGELSCGRTEAAEAGVESPAPPGGAWRPSVEDRPHRTARGPGPREGRGRRIAGARAGEAVSFSTSLCGRFSSTLCPEFLAFLKLQH
jgi:hypothetical protein